MRIEFLTQDDPLYILPFFEEFFRHYAADFEIVHLARCRPMGKRSRFRLLRELECLYGPIGFVRLSARLARARFLGLLLRSRSAGRFHTLAQLCDAYEIPHQRIGNPNAREFVNEIRARRPDLIASVACPYILKGPLLGLPPQGCLNIHHAPLPRYKGMMPTFWQMYHGETKVGVTIHYMAAQVDEGAALFQGELEIERRESLDRLIRRTKRYGAHCMAGVLAQIANGTQRVLVLDQRRESYFTFPTLEQIRDFRRRGYRAL